MHTLTDFRFQESELMASWPSIMSELREAFFVKSRDQRNCHKKYLKDVVTPDVYRSLFPPYDDFDTQKMVTILVIVTIPFITNEFF